MFVLNAKRIVKWPVDVPVPMNGGRTETQRFTAVFHLLPDSEVRSLVEQDADNKGLLRRVLVEVEDVGIEGVDLPGIDEIREMLLDHAAVRLALIRAYFQALQGIASKNVVTPPPGGPAASETAAAAAAPSPRT